MTAAAGRPHSGSWKYRLGLLLILAVVLIWVASAEVTQLIFEKYRHPFLLTWLGASLLALYLPLAYFREWATPLFSRCSSQSTATAQQILSRQLKMKAHGSSNNLGAHKSTGSAPSPNGPLSPSAPVKELEMTKAAKAVPKPGSVVCRSPKTASEDEEGDEEEGAPLLSRAQDEGSLSKPRTAAPEQMGAMEVAACAALLAPVWLLTEYLSNAALSMTSVASTTILSSTSGLFTLLFGVTLGGERLTMAKLLAALVSIAGVVMTELGKSSAADDSQVFGDADRNPGETAGDLGLPGHNLVGDICGLLSAVSYGFYTTLLRKYVGGEEEGDEEKADLQKVFGYIGLFTFFGLWWLVIPLHFLGWEPAPRLPSSYGLDEDILANALVGSMISDYFWAVSVVWTTPLVATLGLSLTIPLAMVADMVMHGRDYSTVYIVGACGVFAGFIVANMGDKWCSKPCLPEGWSQKLCACCPPGWQRRHPPPIAHDDGL